MIRKWAYRHRWADTIDKANKNIMIENLYTPDCIRTVSGNYVNVFSPNPDTITIEDIAHALSMQCRFGAHLPKFYSVAYHSIEVCGLCSSENKIAGLLHDASEAYLLDIPSPIKQKLSNYKEIEDVLMNVIANKFGFSWPLVDEVKKADETMLVREWNEIMLCKGGSLVNFSQQATKTMFLQIFNNLRA